MKMYRLSTSMKLRNNDLGFKALIATTLGLAVVLAGCASAPPTKAPPASSTPAPAAIPAAKAAVAPAAPVAAPGGPSGTVVFFRPSKFAGGAVSFKVREGDRELGKLSSGSYFQATLPTGAHEFTVHSEAKDVLNLEVEPGETYYVQGGISMGLMVGRPNLSPSSADAFNALKDKLKNSAEAKK
jgi:hypothetical protein